MLRSRRRSPGKIKLSEDIVPVKPVREPVLSPVDRISELLFGLLMALSFVGAVSVAESGRTEIREMFVAALGCNLAWGLVDAVMYLVRVVTDRGRGMALIRAVQAAAQDVQAGRDLIAKSIERDVAGLFSPAEIEAIRTRMVALPAVPSRPALEWNDFPAAAAIFLLVVVATFPVVLPFAVMHDVALAKTVSRGIALAMLFVSGLALGRYAGYGSWKAGIIMVGLGTVLVLAIHALGG